MFFIHALDHLITVSGLWQNNFKATWVGWAFSVKMPQWILNVVHLDRLVMMSVHVADEEVEDRHVHDVEQSPALVVRPHLLHDITVILNKIHYIKTY